MGAYLTAVTADNPVHYWRCADPGGGLGHDIGSSPKHIHGLGSPISTPFGYSGPNSDGGSMDLALDGVYANTGDGITVAVNAFSLEMLVWIWQELSTLGILMQVQNANQIALYNGGADWRFLYNTVVLTNANNHTAQAWHHLVATYDGANMRLYVDNIVAGPAGAAAQANVNTLLEISTNQSLSNWGHAFYSEVAVYATALSAARVAAHFNAIDQIGQVPVFSSANGTPAAPSTQLASILAAVQATYANTP